MNKPWFLGHKITLALLFSLSLAGCIQPIAAPTPDRFAGTWAGTMSFDVDPEHKEEIQVVIPEGCQVGAVCGSLENTSVACTWELTLTALTSSTFEYNFSNTLSGDCANGSTGKLVLQADGTLMREHKTPDFIASGPLVRQK